MKNETERLNPGPSEYGRQKPNEFGTPGAVSDCAAIELSTLNCKGKAGYGWLRLAKAKIFFSAIPKRSTHDSRFHPSSIIDPSPIHHPSLLPRAAIIRKCLCRIGLHLVAWVVEAFGQLGHYSLCVPTRPG